MATFNLIIVSAERKIFEGAVKQIQATGVEGELGILPNHTPLMTAIKPGIVKSSAGTYTACTEVIEPVLVEVIRSCNTPISSANVGW